MNLHCKLCLTTGDVESLDNIRAESERIKRMDALVLYLVETKSSKGIKSGLKRTLALHKLEAELRKPGCGELL